MGRILRPEKLTAPQLFGSNVGIKPGGLVNIGGKQFKSGDLVPAPFPSFTGLPNTLFFVYAVSGSLQLVTSQSPPSVGPAGFNASKLVTAFYSNGLSSVDFGNFVGINESPKVRATPLDLGLIGVTIGNATQDWTYERSGQNLRILGGLVVGSSTAILSGFGLVNPIPGTNWVARDISGNPGRFGTGTILDAGTPANNQNISFQVNDGTTMFLLVNNGVNLTNVTVPFTWTTNDKISLDVTIEIAEWNNIPLKDS